MPPGSQMMPASLTWQPTSRCPTNCKQGTAVLMRLHETSVFPIRVGALTQARATLQEMLRIFAVITKFDPVSSTVDQMRNTLSFLEMLDMTPAQVKVWDLQSFSRLNHIWRSFVRLSMDELLHACVVICTQNVLWPSLPGCLWHDTRVCACNGISS